MTEEEVLKAIAEGYNDVESLKRYTAAFMGPCQGKLCMMNFLEVFSRESGRNMAELHPPTLRPPVKPVPIWAFLDDD